MLRVLNSTSSWSLGVGMGARPLRRVIQQKVEDPLSDGLLSGNFDSGVPITVDVGKVTDEDGVETDDIVLRGEGVHAEDDEKEMTPMS